MNFVADVFEKQFIKLSELHRGAFQDQEKFSGKLVEMTEDEIKNFMSELQSAKEQLTKKVSTTEPLPHTNENDNKSFLFQEFLSEEPGNESPDKVLGFMRDLVFKYAIYVAYLGSRGEKTQEDEAASDAETTTWLNKCIKAL